MMTRYLLGACLLAATVISGCGPGGGGGGTPEAGLPNPASVYCEQNGGKVDLRTDAEGGVAGVCVFPDGSECDEWAYFRGECKPGAIPVTPESKGPAAPQVNKESVDPFFVPEGCPPAASKLRPLEVCLDK